jgi:hypothetical protein
MSTPFRYVSSSPGLHLVHWGYDHNKEEFLQHPIDGPIIGWQLPPCLGQYSIPYTPQGQLDEGLGLWAVLSSDDQSVFWPENGRRYASIAAWLADAEVNRQHARRHYPPSTFAAAPRP